MSFNRNKHVSIYYKLMLLPHGAPQRIF